MVSPTSLEYYYVKAYQNFLKFFQEEIGISSPLRDTLPDSAISYELQNARENGFTEVGKGIVAKHTLLSFFPQIIRDNPLIQLYVHKKLLIGKSPLTKRSLTSLASYFSHLGDSLENQIKNSSDLAEAMLRAMSKLLPDDRVDYYFNNYLKIMIQWKDSILEDNYVFIDSIVDDFWITENWHKPPEDLSMLLELSFLFDKLKFPFSKEYFQTYIQQNPQKLKTRNAKWITDDNYLNQMWDRLASKGVNFLYYVNYCQFGLQHLYFIIQIHPNSDPNLLKFALKTISGLYYIYENRSQKSCVFLGVILLSSHDQDFITRFFDSLKEYGTLVDYILIKGTKIEEIITENANEDRNLYSKVIKKESTSKSYNIDVIDSIFLQGLQKSGFIGFPLGETKQYLPYLKDLIESRILELKKREHLTSTYKILLKKPADSMKIIFPQFLALFPFRTLNDCIEGINLTEIECLFFYQKWYLILSQMNKVQTISKIKSFNSLKNINSKSYIYVTNEIQELRDFLTKHCAIKNITSTQQYYPIKSILIDLLNRSNSSVILNQLISD